MYEDFPSNKTRGKRLPVIDLSEIEGRERTKYCLTVWLFGLIVFLMLAITFFETNMLPKLFPRIW